MHTNSVQNQSTNFKSTFPVQHWLAENARGSYALADAKTTRKLQGKIIRILNKSLEESSKPMDTAEQNLRTYIEACDIDYKNICELERRKSYEARYKVSGKNKENNITKVRTFYDRESSSIDGYAPYSYIISGKDISTFEDELAKNIGKEKRAAKELLSHPYSPETKAAIDLYNISGINFVNNPDLRIKSKKTGMTYVLHTKFEIVRNKLGKIKDYRLIDARFLPEHGAENPFVRLGWVKG